uniref:Uncharacterized protein n=1 Tax=Utricularia reniformis TaxID=192314 RepID=A0A1Y0B2N5_9LAMI|nr:hypothetical protein AEK19_MT1440 [Utricularia reniformis]ART31633.1 hypothetical protein AEK19_MT1440 [Utricularia reniformis]
MTGRFIFDFFFDLVAFSPTERTAYPVFHTSLLRSFQSI